MTQARCSVATVSQIRQQGRGKKLKGISFKWATSGKKETELIGIQLFDFELHNFDGELICDNSCVPENPSAMLNGNRATQELGFQ